MKRRHRTSSACRSKAERLAIARRFCPGTVPAPAIPEPDIRAPGIVSRFVAWLLGPWRR